MATKTSTKAIKPTAKTVAKSTAAGMKKMATVARTASVPKKPATKAGSENTLAQTVRDFIAKTFADTTIEQPRAVCIKYFMDKLGMQKTTASTYFSNAIRAALLAEHKAAEQRLQEGKPVYSVYKLNHESMVTSVGMFVSASSAENFNKLYRHNGVVKGSVEIGTIQKDCLATKKKAVKKAA